MARYVIDINMKGSFRVWAASRKKALTILEELARAIELEMPLGDNGQIEFIDVTHRDSDPEIIDIDYSDRRKGAFDGLLHERY